MLENISGFYRKTGSLQKGIFYFILGTIWSLSNVGYVKYTSGILPWFTFGLFLYFIREEDYKKGSLYSLVYGAALYITHLWWMTNPAFDLIRLGSFSVPVKILICAGVSLLCLVLWVLQGTLYPVFFVAVKFISRKNPYLFLAAAPFVFTALDFFYPKIWNDQLGYSQYVFFNLSQPADIFGVPGITFLIISCNSALLAALTGLFKSEKKVLHFTPLVLVLLVALLSAVYGRYRVDSIQKKMTETEPVRIGIVQGNISGFDKRTHAFKDILGVYSRLSARIMPLQPDLIVWPESAVTIAIPDTMDTFEWLNRFGQVPVLFGTHYFKKKEQKLYNSMFLVSADSRMGGVYNKQKLVPISEEFPITRLNFLMTLYGYAYFTRGENYLHLKSGRMVIAPNICYEAVFPDYIRNQINSRGSEEKANILINGTNDSWFGPWLEPDMHLAISGFRSIENRISLVRATCTGYSAHFDPTGRLRYRSQLFQEQADVQEVYLMQENTLFQKGGWLFVYILAFAVLGILVFRVFQKYRAKIRQ